MAPKDTKAGLRKLVGRGVMVGQWSMTEAKPLAEGAFGVVVRVERANVQGVAKIEPDESMCRIGAEAIYMRILGTVPCPGIPKLLDNGSCVIGDKKFMFHVTTPFGETLSARVARGPMSEFEVVSLGAQLLETLKAMHSRRFVYVDMKPDNVLWSPAEGRWGLVDFGSLTPPIQLNKYVFNGTPEFASSRSLAQGGSRFDDDIEALVHLLAWCERGGQLPWSVVVMTEAREYLKARSRFPLAGLSTQLSGLAALASRLLAHPKGPEPLPDEVYTFLHPERATRTTATGPKTPKRTASSSSSSSPSASRTKAPSPGQENTAGGAKLRDSPAVARVRSSPLVTRVAAAAPPKRAAAVVEAVMQSPARPKRAAKATALARLAEQSPMARR